MSHVLCYNDIIVMSVNTYMSVMGFNTEDKCLMKCLRQNRKYGAKQLLKMILTKTGVLVDWRRWSKKLTTWVLSFDLLGSGRPRTVCTVPGLSIFLISAFKSTKSRIFVKKHLSNRFAPYYSFSYKGWNFCTNWLMWLEVTKENKRGFFSEHSVLIHSVFLLEFNPDY